MSSVSKSDDRIQRGKKLLRSGEYSAAGAVFQQIIEENPDDVAAHESLGNACFLAGDYDAAIEAFQKVTRLDPKQARACVNLGAVYNRKQEFKQAIDMLRRALQRDRACAEAYYNMGLAHKGLNQTKMAVSAYREAIRLAPDMAEAHLNLANLYAKNQSYPQAESHYEKALQLRPGFQRAENGLQQTRQAVEDQRRNSSPFGRLVPAATVFREETPPTQPTARLTKELRDSIYQAAADAGSTARLLAAKLKSECEQELLAMSRTVTRNAEQSLLIQDSQADFRETLRTIVPLFEALESKARQLKDAVNQPAKK